MHENAEISTNQKLTRDLLETMLSLQPRTSGSSGKSRDQIIAEVSLNIEGQTPLPFDINSA
jgi:dynein heavy chain